MHHKFNAAHLDFLVKPGKENLRRTAELNEMYMQYYTFMGEMTGQIEFYILEEGRGSGKSGHMGYKPRVRPYLYAGEAGQGPI